MILTRWYDPYDMVARAEYRGIGIYGNKEVVPDIEKVWFGVEVASLVQPGKESEGFRTRAKAVGEARRKSGRRGRRWIVAERENRLDDSFDYLERTSSPEQIEWTHPTNPRHHF
jgi:hypothetical protein